MMPRYTKAYFFIGLKSTIRLFKKNKKKQEYYAYQSQTHTKNHIYIMSFIADQL